MKPPRGLSEEEAAAWSRLAATVKPLDKRRSIPLEVAAPSSSPTPPPASKPAKRASRPSPRVVLASPPPAAPDAGLDSHWDRRIKAGAIEPDFTLDLHGHGLDAAYDRLMSGVAQARAMGARTILLVAGKSRPVAAADRGSSRGAIRAKVLDWLAASEHGSAIASIRKAHIRHGGEGALYIVLRRQR